MKSFKDMDLNPLLAKGIAELGFETLTPIQAETLPLLLGEPTDFLGMAATGTGKTAAFGIPMLERLDPSLRSAQALVMCPTRELAIQVAGQLNLMARYLSTKALPVYGGASYGEQIRGIKQGASVIVGTPGRIMDHLERGTLSLDHLSVVVLDEADRMLEMGFKDDITAILGAVPEESCNTWLFSATMGREVRKVADAYLREPEFVQINREEMLPENLQQLYYVTSEANKPEVLRKLIEAADDFYGIVFCQTKSLVTDLTEYLAQNGYRVDCLHGDKDQRQRERTMKAFRDRAVNLLVCTDVAARGLDVKDITHVINYSIPREFDSYVHRIGRTARSGKDGFAMSLVNPSQRGLVPRLEKVTKSKIREGQIPTRKEIGAKKVAMVRDRFLKQEAFARAVDLMSPEWKETLSAMSAEEVAGRFLAMQYPDVFLKAPQAEEETAERAPRKDKRKFERRRDHGFAGFRVERKESRGGFGKPFRKQRPFGNAQREKPRF